MTDSDDMAVVLLKDEEVYFKFGDWWITRVADSPWETYVVHVPCATTTYEGIGECYPEYDGTASEIIDGHAYPTAAAFKIGCSSCDKFGPPVLVATWNLFTMGN